MQKAVSTPRVQIKQKKPKRLPVLRGRFVPLTQAEIDRLARITPEDIAEVQANLDPAMATLLMAEPINAEPKRP